MEHRIPVPADVLNGLEAVRVSGKTNMFDLAEVVRLAVEMDFIDAAMWIENNRSAYCRGLLQGFAAVEEGGTS